MCNVRASLAAQLVKNPPAMQETLAPFLGWEDPLEKGKATHSSILENSMVSPWGHKESDRAEQLSTFTFWSLGNGNPLQYPCLENPMDGRAWWATVHGVEKSRTRLSGFTSLPCAV